MQACTHTYALADAYMWCLRTFDDNMHTAGNVGPRNVCLLAKYGDGGEYACVTVKPATRTQLFLYTYTHNYY
jgi:hypothetical protein